MRVLEFIVNGQSLKKSPDCDFSNIVSGSEGYLKAEFTFSSEWHDCVKAASFWFNDHEYPVLIEDDGSCVIPKEALTGDRFQVSVLGVKSGYKIRTTKTKVRQEV